MNPKVIEHIVSRRILIAVLNWGQGHIYRTIPIIQQLINQKNTIHIACDDTQKLIFEAYLNDEVTFHFLAGYDFRFSTTKSILLANFFQFPSLLKQHAKDHVVCEKIVSKEAIDLVLSDHRYGWFSQKVESIFLTHQCQLPIKNKWVQKTHHRFINTNFNAVWIFDTEQHDFAQALSETQHIHPEVQFLNAVSRFENYPTFDKTKTVAVISGPKPYNEHLLRQVQDFATRNQSKIYCISSLNFQSEFLIPVSFDQQDRLLAEAHTIISYIGYTTLMDLHYLQPNKAILIPSPRQLEQEYLAQIHTNKYDIRKQL